jgi:hypothetical protein
MSTSTAEEVKIVRQPRTWVERLIAMVLLTDNKSANSSRLWNTLIRWDDAICAFFSKIAGVIRNMFESIGLLSVWRYIGRGICRYLDYILNIPWRRMLEYASACFIVVWKRFTEYVSDLYLIRLRRVLRFWITATAIITVSLVMAGLAKEGKIDPPYAWIQDSRWSSLMKGISWSNETYWVQHASYIYWALIVPAFVLWSPVLVPFTLLWCAFTNMPSIVFWLVEYGCVPLKMIRYTIGKVFDRVILIIAMDLIDIALWICWNLIVPLIKFLWLLAQLGWTGITFTGAALVALPSTLLAGFWLVAQKCIELMSTLF